MKKMRARMGVSIKRDESVLDGGLYSEFKRLRRDQMSSLDSTADKFRAQGRQTTLDEREDLCNFDSIIKLPSLP
jgi:hypothetical protein